MRERIPSEDDTSVDLASEALLPTQVMTLGPAQRTEPEARLALAVIEDAVLTLRLAAATRDGRARMLAAEARAWIVSDDTSHPFAFVSLCEYLGLEPAWLRAGIRRRVLAGVRQDTVADIDRGRRARARRNRRWRGRETAPSDAA